ncbi:hypothetical protein JCM6882_008776 [Rhodosporidiobolus microsporus]
MSYASSNSSDGLSDHSTFDPFHALAASTFDPFAASFSSHCNSPPSFSPASSVASSVFDVDDQYTALKRNTDSFIQTLLKSKREQEVALRAWRVRCDALESEVLRLSGLVLQLETEAKEKTGKVTVVEEVQTDHSHHCHSPPAPTLPVPTGCDCSPDCSAPTPCRWTGAAWEPLPAPKRPTIDPTKPMSRQNPPPCNAFYLVGHCDVPRCRFEHGYELTEEQVAEMRRGAKHHVCNAIRNGVECPDGEDCIYGHYCPRGPSCGRERCGFNDEQHRVVPSPRPIVRRR